MTFKIVHESQLFSPNISFLGEKKGLSSFDHGKLKILYEDKTKQNKKQTTTFGHD